MKEDTLCELWRRVLAHPGDATAVAALRPRLTELVAHVADCDACDKASHDAANLEAVYEALGAIPSEYSPEELKAFNAAEQAWADDDRAIERAVTDALLPAVGARLRRIETLGRDVTPLALFLAINAVSLVAFSHASLDKPETLALRSEGIFLNGKLIAERGALVKEMARHARITARSAAAIFEWIFEAAASVPEIFLHFSVTSASPVAVTLRVEKPSLNHNLMLRWKPVDALPEFTKPRPQPVSARPKKVDVRVVLSARARRKPFRSFKKK